MQLKYSKKSINTLQKTGKRGKKIQFYHTNTTTNIIWMVKTFQSFHFYLEEYRLQIKSGQMFIISAPF